MYCKTSQHRGVKFHFLTSMRPVPVASPSPSGFISRLPAYTLTVPLDTPPHYLENQKTWVSCIAGRFFTIWATREAPIYINSNLLSTERQLFLNYSGITASILRNFKMFEAWNSEIIKFKNIFKEKARFEFMDYGKSKRVPEKHLFLLYWLCQSLWLWITINWKILQVMGNSPLLNAIWRQ